MRRMAESKKIRTILVIALAVALALPIVASAATAAYVNTKTDRLNLREGPGFQYRIIASFPRGTKVEVLSVKDGWAYVKVEGRYGYMFEGYLSSVHPDSIPEAIYEEVSEPEPTAAPIEIPSASPTPEEVPPEPPATGDAA